MTTGPEELSLNYLLDPAFQLVNTAGRPLTNGWIEVYYHGTRDKYYCASDFDGTLHPFRIPLDSLGSNIVLADPNFSYDIYVYNSFGSLQMSRYNVNPGSGSGGGSSSEGGPAEHWSSDTAGGASTTVTGGTTVYLTLPSSEDQPEFVDHTTDTAIFLKEGLYHIDAVVSFKQDEDDLQNIIKDLVVNTGLIGWDAQMTGQKNWTGPESTDDDRHFLELHTVVSVPEDLLQPLYFQISSPVDLDSAAIEKLDIIKLEAGGNGIKYTGGYGIDISNQVISVTGMMPEASAANFVYNSTYQVDIQNIYETIAETSAMIPSGVATEQWVTDYTSAFITSADLPDLSDYATQQWVEDYTSAFITEDALDGYATQQWVEDQHYITSADIPPIPQDVITSGELATVSGDIVAQIPSLDGYATEQWVNEHNFITSADLPQSVPLVAGEGISIVDTSASTIISVDSAYSPGVSEEWVEDYVSDATSGFITSADIPDIPDDLVTSGELATVSGDIMNEIPDTSDMATQTWVGQQGYLTSVPAEYATSGDLVTLSGAIEAEIPNYTAGDNISIVNDEISVSGTAGLIAGENITFTASGDNYVISSIGGEIPADLVTSGQLATVSAQIENDIPDLTGYATQTWVDSRGYLDQVWTNNSLDGDGTAGNPLRVTSAYIWNSAYNAINDSASYWNDAAGMNEYPISAGPGMSIEDVDGVTVFQTSGTMMDDLIEFNSQDEISGYNGHPVMTVDSEKQWLTHDDTIAHVTNSAQYAFGVNVPVVAQAMGTDETVLWSGSRTSACTLSEPVSGFNWIRIEKSIGDDTIRRTSESYIGFADNVSNNQTCYLSIGRFKLDGTSLNVENSKTINFGGWSSTGTTYSVQNNWDFGTNIITRVTGIGRKEN